MMDLPPQQPTEPSSVEVQKMDLKLDLIKKFKTIFEETKDIKDFPANLPMRAYFLDVCNATNFEEIFSFSAANWLLEGCRDGLEVRNMEDYGIDPALLKYHISTDEFFTLIHWIEDTGKGTSGIYKMPAKDCASDTFRAIYTIMSKNPDFTPKFTTFTFGGTMADMPPLRDKDGNPNMDFFRAWQQKTEDYYYRK